MRIGQAGVTGGHPVGSRAGVGLAHLLPPVDPEQLAARLRLVIDPELGVNIVDLGLVYEVEARAGVATVLMTTTSPACPIGSYLEDAVRWAVLDVPGVVDVVVGVTHQPPWSPERMTDAGRRALGVPGA